MPDLGIDLSDSLYVPDGATSTYLFLADSNGDMALAMNDMAIYEQLTPAFLETKLTTLNAAALVVLDTNLSAESIRYLGEHCTAPLFADPVSAAKAGSSSRSSDGSTRSSQTAWRPSCSPA